MIYELVIILGLDLADKGVKPTSMLPKQTEFPTQSDCQTAADAINQLVQHAQAHCEERP